MKIFALLFIFSTTIGASAIVRANGTNAPDTFTIGEFLKGRGEVADSGPQNWHANYAKYYMAYKSPKKFSEISCDFLEGKIDGKSTYYFLALTAVQDAAFYEGRSIRPYTAEERAFVSQLRDFKLACDLLTMQRELQSEPL